MYLNKKLLEKALKLQKKLDELEFSELSPLIKKKSEKETYYQEMTTFLMLHGIKLKRQDITKIKKSITPLSKGKIYNLVRNFDNTTRLVNSIKELNLNLSMLQQINRSIGNNILDYWDLGRIRQKGEIPSFTELKSLGITLPQLISPDEISKIISECQKESLWFFKLLIWLSKYPLVAPFTHLNISTMLFASKTFLSNEMPKAGKLLPQFSIHLTIFLKINEEKNLEKSLEFIITKYTEELENILLVAKNKLQRTITSYNNLTTRQLKALNYLKKYKKISRQKYASLFNISFMTAYRDLQKLKKLGYVEKRGVGKSTLYYYKA